MGTTCLLTHAGANGRVLLAIADRAKLKRVLPRVLDPEQFLSEYGLRSMSKGLAAEPYMCHGNVVAYEPAESTAPMYGGNSNWRGPVWFPVNYLLIEALREYGGYFGDSLRVEMPRGSGRPSTLSQVADLLARRLVRIFLRDGGDKGRPVFGGDERFLGDPRWSNYIPFFEYFHGDNGGGLGASHQTGWTALVCEFLRQRG